MKKRILAALLAVLFLLPMGACSQPGGGGKTIEGTVEEVLEKVTGDLPVETSLLTTPVTEENFAWYFYIDPVEGAEGMASEAAMSAVPHAICLLKLPEDADAEQVQADIEEALNPHKWVCVEAEANEVARQGQWILVAQSTKDVVDQAVENFNALAQ